MPQEKTAKELLEFDKKLIGDSIANSVKVHGEPIVNTVMEIVNKAGVLPSREYQERIKDAYTKSKREEVLKGLKKISSAFDPYQIYCVYRYRHALPASSVVELLNQTKEYVYGKNTAVGMAATSRSSMVYDSSGTLLFVKLGDESFHIS